MKVGAIVLARLTSSRLPGKGLKYFDGLPLLYHIFLSLKKVNRIDEIIIATSSDSEDDEIEHFCKKFNIKIYRGSLSDVSGRFLQAANKFDLDYAIRINGDNLFIYPKLISDMCSYIGEYEFISNVPRRTFPKGMSVEIVDVGFYKNEYNKFKTENHREHVTAYLYENDRNIKKIYIENNENDEAFGIQLAIDSEYDFILANRILSSGFELSYELDLNALVNKIKENIKNMNFYGKHGPLLIAEIGGNHEGDFEYAKKLTKLAIESDSDFIKFQIYSGNTLVNPVESPERHQHFKKFELSREQYRELAQIVIQSGKKFMASIWCKEMVDWVDEYNPIYKIGSGDLLSWPLLKYLSQKGKPIILSTGLATEEEVESTVKYIRNCNSLYNDPNYLAVLQCTSMYPIPSNAANLGVMNKLKEITNTTVGYSDHTEGLQALKYAIPMGAQVLEYHFTDSREDKVFRDHKVSLTKPEVLELIEYIKTFNIYKGSKIKKPTEIEVDNGHLDSFRRAVYPARDLPKGHKISEGDLVILRPSHGLSSRYYDDLLGKITKNSLTKHQVIGWDDFSND